LAPWRLIACWAGVISGIRNDGCLTPAPLKACSVGPVRSRSRTVCSVFGTLFRPAR